MAAVLLRPSSRVTVLVFLPSSSLELEHLLHCPVQIAVSSPRPLLPPTCSSRLLKGQNLQEDPPLPAIILILYISNASSSPPRAPKDYSSSILTPHSLLFRLPLTFSEQMHIISSTATFTLSNPLSSKPVALSFPLDFDQPQSSLKAPILTITSISAHAYHNKSSSNALNTLNTNIFTPSDADADSDSDFNTSNSDLSDSSDSEPSSSTPENDNDDDDDFSEIGTISYSTPFNVPPGISESPRLPVKWSLDGLGTVREALGGRLKLDARAVVGVRISFTDPSDGGGGVGGWGGGDGAEGDGDEDDGAWEETIWFHGKGIGAHVRL